MTKILPCKRHNHYQDKKYGEGKRVHNRFRPKSTTPHWRCTVCKTEKQT